jgi:hypothetical protein
MEKTEEQKTVAPNELTVWLVQPSVYLMLNLKQDKDAPRQEQ